MPTLDWIGKSAVKEHHQEVPFHLLEEDESRSAGAPDTENLLVQGDNLKALKALLPRYAGQVDCVYIDPPYNTGNEGWSYSDSVDSPEIRDWLGKTVGKEGEDLKLHDKWCCMMYPRLVLLRELLAEDGSFWMSIDDHEVHHARTLLNEVFGPQNFVAQVVWQKKYATANDHTGISPMHDYILVYRASSNFERNLLARPESKNEQYRHEDEDGRFRIDNYTCNKNSKERPNLYYPVENPNTGEEIWPSKTAVWRYSKERHEQNIERDLVYWGEDGKASTPGYKRYLHMLRGGGKVVPSTWWPHEKAGHTDEAKKEVREIFSADGDADFPTPKPMRLIERILDIATQPGDLVLDSFAGSGTTGHAVLQKNAREDGAGRRFILVELEEEIAQNVTAERLRRAVEGYAYEGTETTELLRKDLTVRTLKKMDKVLAETERLKKEHADEYDGFSRRSKDGVLTLEGKKKIEAHKEGLGGGFRYCTLGPPLLDEMGLPGEQVSSRDVARHVFFSATARPLTTANAGADDSPLVGIDGDTAVYLLPGALGTPSGDGVATSEDAPDGVLTEAVLDALPAHDGPRIIYGAACQISKEHQSAAHITFRQVPYALRTS